MQAECSNVGDVPSMQQRVCDQLLTPAEMGSVLCQNAILGMGDQVDERLRSTLPKLDSHASTGPRGKENKDPRLTRTGSEVESGEVFEQELQKRRPLPRPLPDLVVNILQANKHVMSSAPDDKGTTADSIMSLDQSTLGKEQESSSTDGEPGVPLEPAGERSYPVRPGGRQREVTNCRDSAYHKYSGESDESLRSNQSTKKMRFDPTAGEEGKFYYASDLENTGCEDVHRLPVLRADNEDCQVQCQEPSTEHPCTRCSKPLSRKSVHRQCVSRQHSLDGVASTDYGTIVVNRQKEVVPEWGPGSRYEEISTLVYVTDRDYESASSTKTIGARNNSARQRRSSNLCSRRVHVCVKCSRNSAKCTRCSCLLNGKFTRKSKANWKTTETETDGYSSEEDMNGFHPKLPSDKKSLVTGGEHVPQMNTKTTEALGQTGSACSGELTTSALVDKKISELRAIPYETSREDYLSPESNASFTNASRGRSPPVRPIACSVHGTRVGEGYDNREENVPEDESDHRSEPKAAVFQVNHEKVENSSQSETQYSESLKCSSLVDKKIVKPRIHRSRAREENCCRASADGRLQLGSAPASQCPPHAEMKVKFGLRKDGETPITLPNLHCKAPIPKRPIGKCIRDDEQADVEIEKQNADVEHLLGKFIRSNAECAELIKCFQSKALTNPLGCPTSSKRISKQKAEAEGKPRDNSLHKMHHSTGKTTLKQPTKCTGCLKTELIWSLASSDGPELKDTEMLCGKCSTSKALLKKPELVYSATQVGGKNPLSDLRTSTDIRLNDDSKLDDMYSESLPIDCLPRENDHKTSTPAAEPNESKVEKTEDWQIGLFDISLFHLVNDLEVDETEYWNQINTTAIEENTDVGKYDTRRKRVLLEKGRASTASRWCHPSRHINGKHFR